MTKTIILLSGKQRSGKDTAAKFMSEKGFKRVAFADVLKEEVSTAYGITLDRLDNLKNTTEQYRSLLISWARCRTMTDPLYFVTKALIEVDKSDDEFIVITDFRFKHEKEMLHKFFPDAGVLTVRIECDDTVRKSRGVTSNASDASEIALDDFRFDLTIFNKGTEKEFKDSVMAMADSSLELIKSNAASIKKLNAAVEESMEV